ncbi:muscle segmentation homeobox [Trichinella spiralis]|uniref:muscle segmentation homeobox n=1 Tax=Trichinella spiralis TaxID=6334 RepID=UPI0001EFCB73|nr:muscle segmentation homeobox [Trichinella spiralis]
MKKKQEILISLSNHTVIKKIDRCEEFWKTENYPAELEKIASTIQPTLQIEQSNHLKERRQQQQQQQQNAKALKYAANLRRSIHLNPHFLTGRRPFFCAAI